ncbi:MAG: hypothetical protein PHE56_08190 [Bacteroidales bacterium]|nr:hypothetical protein [Bacteroidales bacterium]
MAQKTANKVIKTDLSELISSASLLVNNTIPNSVDKHKVHYELLVANKVDKQWFVAIPKTDKIKFLKETIENVVKSDQPSAIMLIIYKNNSEEFTRYQLKLDDGFVPVTDENAPEIKVPGKVVETPDVFHGLGALQGAMMDNIKKENQLENQKTQYENKIALLELQHAQTVRELTREKETLSKELEEIKVDFRHLLAEVDQLNEELSEKSSEFNDVKKNGMNLLMGLFAKNMDSDFDLKGFLGEKENETKPTKEIPEKEIEIEYEEVGKTTETDPVKIISQFLKEIEDIGLRDRIILILQHIATNNELAAQIIEHYELKSL